VLENTDFSNTFYHWKYTMFYFTVIFKTGHLYSDLLQWEALLNAGTALICSSQLEDWLYLCTSINFGLMLKSI
jgi:hypothetical protein